MQIFNVDNDPFYIELRGGHAFWLIPDQYTFADVKYLTHLTEEGNQYYEYLPTNEVSWTLPPDTMMASSARSKALGYQRMTREKMEEALLEPFPEEESAEQMAELDAYFETPPQDNTDEYGANVENNNPKHDHLSDDEADEATPVRRKSKTSRESPTYTEGDRSSDESDAENALASINVKGRRSGGTSGDDSDGDYSAMYKNVQDVFEKPSRPLSVAIIHKTIETVKETTIKVILLFSQLFHLLKDPLISYHLQNLINSTDRIPYEAG